MITSDRQLKVAKEKLEQLKASLREGPSSDVPKFLHAAREGQYESMIEEISAEIEEYESLKVGGIDAIDIISFEDLRLAPIKYRIAAHMTQDAFARFVDVNLRQIARYEEEEYENLSVETLESIIAKLPLDISGRFTKNKAAR